MSTTHQLPNRVFPVPYQVDFSVESKGRHLDSTKRKLIWKFGFAHPPAVFPHLFDANENSIIGDNNDGNGNNTIPYPANPKKGVECRGREHEIILTWSLLTGKAHIYVDSKEIYRQSPLKDEIFNPFSAQFHKGFELPNSKFNGRHRIDIRCYARTPMGAKNMVVDANGGKFRQYDLTVDGLSYFSFPAMFEMGTERMWSKVSRWGLMRLESQEEDTPHGGGTHGEHHHRGGSTGRSVDEYYFDKAKQQKQRKDRNRYGQDITNSEYKAMSPKSETEEERMTRIALEASLKDWEKDSAVGYSSSSEENDSSFGNGGRKEHSSHSHHSSHSQRPVSAKKGTTNRMASIGEDNNLIDFGNVSDATGAMSQITISRQTTSDVSVLGDDDATTASFMLNTAWGSQNGAAAQQQQQQQQPLGQQLPTSPGQMYPNQYQQQQPPPPYQDPTFRAQYAQQQQPWSSVGTISSNPTTPRNGGVGGRMPSDASFAVPPPPTWDDYNNAFGGSMRSMGGASVMGGSTVMVNNPMMSPMASPASVGMTSPMTSFQQQPPPQYGMQQQQQQLYQSPSPHVVTKSNRFDPLRADPF